MEASTQTPALIIYYNPQLSEYLPLLQDISQVTQFVEEHDPAAEDGQTAHFKVNYLPASSMPTSPPSRPSVISQPPPPTKQDGMVIIRDHNTQYELVLWYHKVQWRHSCQVTKHESTQTFNEYLASHLAIHFSLSLLSFTIPERQVNYELLIGTYKKIQAELDKNPEHDLDKLLALHGMKPLLYAKIGRILSGEKPPFLNFIDSIITNREGNDINLARKAAGTSPDGGGRDSSAPSTALGISSAANPTTSANSRDKPRPEPPCSTDLPGELANLPLSV
ncbi:hypothetical protein PtA15_18A310 [Puccinia triticina]|uniref:Uncharacterized protein n=1 Tax=Puccinia triticina TaxID=208348 RepID=A0ABY7DE23_9BASI|nr:uncharacterized protein PtA15_18A310 [Puccinia triticina]WAQ93252.1 hypothetical protein PtA15_18A310 [Puccinia triticina]